MYYSTAKFIVKAATLIILISAYNIIAQPRAIAAVHYSQISSFDTDYAIADMKMSADGSKIVFATGGPQVKVFTISSSGHGLKLVYDFQSTGSAPFIDISPDGEKVIWCDRFGEIYFANADGTGRIELATLLPNPDTTRASLEPVIPLPPRITADGGTVFFMNVDRDQRVSGVWSINTNNTSLTQIFNYIDVATQVYGRDGTEYIYNSAFTDGFDINGDGSRIIFGTRLFKIEEGDFNRGDAIVAYGTTFYKLSDYALGNQPFATNMDDDVYLVFKREFNTALQYDEINVYFQPLGSGSPIKVITGIETAGAARMSQISTNGSTGIVHGANGRLPITLVDRVSSSHLDLVSIDGISLEIGGFRFSESMFPSINADGDKFCFLAPSNPPQIWIGNILSDAAGAEPKINGVQFTPNYVFYDGSTTATIEAYVADINDPINLVTFEAVQDGSIYFRALGADPVPFYPELYDDGSYGDKFADDNTYTNNTVKVDLPEVPLGDYCIRIAAVNTSLRHATMVDFATFSIVDEETYISEDDIMPDEFTLNQNYPNPFNPSTTIKYSIPSGVIARSEATWQSNSEITSSSQQDGIPRNDEVNVTLTVYDILGREVAILVNEKQKPGYYEVTWPVGVGVSNQPSGVYFYRIVAGDPSAGSGHDFIKTKKMLLLQ